VRRATYRFDEKRFSQIPPSRRTGRGKVVAVTGGAGFIGSHLCEALLETGCEVVCIDNFRTGSASNVAHLSQTGRFSVVRHDIMRPLPKNLPQLDEIFNFACPSSPVHFQMDRVGTALTCAMGAFNVLERAERDGARVLQASASQVYGEPEVHPQPEACRGQVSPLGPRACYDEGKRFAETLFADFGEKASLPVKIARIFNTYGPRMQIDDGRVVSNFIVQALSGRDITLYGDGLQTRTFCYVDDVVGGCLKLMASAEDFTGPVNLGDPLEITVADLAHTVLALTGSRSRIVRRTRYTDDPRRRRPDITLAETLLDWRPKISLRDGLERTIESFAQRLDAPPEPGLAMQARA
jgi:UDP-glucuronate decarboxylase